MTREPLGVHTTKSLALAPNVLRKANTSAEALPPRAGV